MNKIIIDNKIIYKILSIFLIFIMIISSHFVYAFDFPILQDTFYLQDNANILSDNIKQFIYNQGKYFFEEKNIDFSFVTISDAVGEKDIYTKELKKWWKIGTKNNGIIIVLFPNSKDKVSIILDENLEQYITKKDILNYKELLVNSLINNSLDATIYDIINNLNSKLENYTNANNIKISTRNFFNTISQNLKINPINNFFNDLNKKSNKFSNKLFN